MKEEEQQICKATPLSEGMLKSSRFGSCHGTQMAHLVGTHCTHLASFHDGRDPGYQ